nr:uncharacterized protein LOC113830501 isoform X2 [Penaeus vannamei]
MEYSSRRTGLPDTHRTVHTKSETGFICADELCKSSSPVTILRDSAADISLVLKEAVPNPDCYTGEMSRDARLFNVLERSSDVRCAIEIPERRKKKRHVHVNLPKKYYERDDLKENTGNQTHFLLQEYDEPFSGVARLCPLLDHAAETRDVQPVLQFPCPVDVMNGRLCKLRFGAGGSRGSSVLAWAPLPLLQSWFLRAVAFIHVLTAGGPEQMRGQFVFTPWDSGQQRLRQEGTRS